MKTETIQNDRISAMLDGELSDAQLEATLTSLSDANNHDGRGTWEIYHQIGDVLRSDELALKMSLEFSARFASLLEAEPVILAPKRQVGGASPEATRNATLFKPQFARYAAMTSIAAAAAVAFFVAPQLMPLLGGQSNSGVVISKIEQPGKTQPGSVQLASGSSVFEVQQKANEHIDMLRDPRLDSYLLAHQKFSPSIANGTQYVTRANAVSASSSAGSLAPEK